MIGLVFVSHSYQLAEGVRELAAQMAESDLVIETAGGIWGGEEWALGTDPMRVLDAIEKAWSSDGVLVLLDLGSALMCTEMAIEMLPPERQSLCLISNAPLVEGGVVAALQAGFGLALEQVNREAEEALSTAKIVPTL